MSQNAPETMGVIYRLQIKELHPHPQNPFAVRDDPEMLALKDSVSKHGVLVPAIARPRSEGGYELIAGHRRKHASELAGIDFMPVIIMDLNDDEAIIQLVDSNIQRENILPSERAKAYKMKLDALKRQGARTDLIAPKGSAKFRSDDKVGEKDGVSGDTVRNYISLNNLTPQLNTQWNGLLRQAVLFFYGGDKIATTRIMALHIGKGRTVSTAISDIIDYVRNPEKTDHGKLISSWQCDSRTADSEFIYSKQQYMNQISCSTKQPRNILMK